MRIGVSFGCLVTPMTLAFLPEAKKAVRHCQKNGWFFQGLPFRQFHKLNVQCDYVEEPWPGIKYVNKTWQWSDEVRPMDRIVFTSPPLASQWLSDQKCGGAEKVDHKFDSGLVEIHKGIGTMAEILEKIRPSTDLVLDTNHLRLIEGFNPKFLAELASKTKLIHVQPKRKDEEWQLFMKGKPTELSAMIQSIKESGYDGDYLVETSPFYHNSGQQNFTQQIKDVDFLLSQLHRFVDQLHLILKT